MTLNPHTEEYYKKFIELQENLRKSEEERLKLEMKFHEMVRVTKEERQMHCRKLRAQYKKFLDEDKRRQDRNDKILQNLERIEARLAMITAKTERFKWLRQQYRAILDRIYKTKLDRSNCTPKEHQQPEQTQKIDRSEHFDNYLKHISTEQVRDRLGNNKITKMLNDYDRKNDLFVDDEEYRPNIANSLADEIVQTIDKFNKNNDRTIVGRQFEKHPEIHIGKLPIESTSSGTDGEFYDKADNDLEKSRIDDLPKVEQIQNKIDDLKIENVEQQQQVIQNSKHNDDIVGKLEQIDTLPIEEINNRQEELQDNESAVREPTEINDNVENCESNREVISEENQPNVLEISPISEIENIAEDSQYDKNIIEPLVSNNNDNIVDEKLQDGESCFDNKGDKNKIAEFLVGDKKENIEATECEQSLQNISKQSDVPVEADMKIDPIDQENNDQSYPEYSPEQRYENAEFLVDDKKENIEAAECEQSLQNISKQPDVPVEIDMKIDPIDQVAITGEENNGQSYPEYSSEQQYENAQYDENGQLIPQFDEHGQLISQYDENGQLIPQYDQNGLLIPQFDENGQLIPQYDQNGQLIPQYDQNGQLIPQYDQYGQIIPQYDENGQIIPQYDENGQLIQHYDEQYYTDPTNQQFENYPDIEQYETKQEQVENDEKSAEVVDEETPKIVENQEQLKVEEKKETVDDGVSKQNVLEILDTVTESVKQDTFENYPNIEQYESKREQVENDEKSAEVVDEEPPKIVENQEELKVEEKKESVDDGVSKQNVLEMLDTDTESVKQDTKISNDSDFDFSNS